MEESNLLKTDVDIESKQKLKEIPLEYIYFILLNLDHLNVFVIIVIKR